MDINTTRFHINYKLEVNHVFSFDCCLVFHKCMHQCDVWQHMYIDGCCCTQNKFITAMSPQQKLKRKKQSISNISMSVHLCNNKETPSTILIGLETMESEAKWKKEIEKVNAKKVGQKTNFIVTAVTVVALFSLLRSPGRRYCAFLTFPLPL